MCLALRPRRRRQDKATFVDHFAGHPITQAAVDASTPLGLWQIGELYGKRELEELQKMSMALFENHGVKMHKAGSPKEGLTYYQTLSATRFPCMCQYTYAGLNAMKGTLQWGGADNVQTTLFTQRLAPFRSKFNIDLAVCPDMVAGNL